MAMLTQARVSRILASQGNGAQVDTSAGYFGELLVSELQGRYGQLALDGKIFTAVASAVTIVSASVSPLAAGTGQPIVGIWNPQNSGVNVAILKHGVQTISGTPGGPIVWNYTLNQAITASTSGTPIPGFLSGAIGAAKLFVNTATTGSTVGILHRGAWNVPAIAAASVQSAAMEEDAGDIIIPPGAFLGLAAYAVGTSHVVNAAITYAELPV